MAQSVEESDIRRDGVSQAERLLAALKPDYVSIDERSIKDLLAFAEAYAADLNFFDIDNNQVAVLDQWQGFFDGIDLDQAVAYLEAPEDFTPEAAQLYARPHFALFLTFLELLQHVQGQLNGLTKRHLDYYYNQVLRLTKRGSIPDQVNVLVDLSPRVKQFELPAGTMLNAGADSEGNNLIYRTDQPITVNKAQVSKLHTVFANKRTIGLQDVWENQDLPPKQALIRLLEMSFGHPLPGDPLPLYPLPTGDRAQRKAITYDDDEDVTELQTLFTLVDFIPNTLYLDFDQYRNLIARKQSYDASLADWALINQILTRAGEAKAQATGNEGQLNFTNERDFDENFKQALNLNDDEVEDLFDGISGVVTLKDAYSRRHDTVVRARINTRLYLPVDETDPDAEDGLTFTAMMQHLIPIDSNWEEIIRIMALARQSKIAADADFNPESPDLPDLELKDVVNFNDILASALGFDSAVPYPEPFVGDSITDLTEYDIHIQELQAYFYMSVKDFHSFMEVAQPVVHSEEPGGNRQTTPEWKKVFAILSAAHRQKVYGDRRAELRALRESEDGGFDAMLYLALGIDDPNESQNPLHLLDQYSLSADNITFLENMRDAEDEIPNSDPDWEKTYRIVEGIQQTILPQPIPQIEKWHNLYPLTDAKSALVKLGVNEEVVSNHWQTFGEASDDAAADPAFGWAITSPLLALSQGLRTVTLTLGFDPAAFLTEPISEMFAASATIPFYVEISTEKGWIPVALSSLKGPVGDYWELSGAGDSEGQDALSGIKFQLVFGEDVDPITALPAEESVFNTFWPVLRLMMKAVASDDEDDAIVPYLMFKELVLRRAHLSVDVKNLQPSHIQNDDTTLKPGKPFEPFGLHPAVGSRFYLSHSELVNKKLDTLKFNIEWMGVPQNLSTHYANYVPPPTADGIGSSIVSNNAGFIMQIDMVNHRVGVPLRASSALFQTNNATLLRPIPINNVVSVVTKAYGSYNRLLDFAMGDEVTEWDRYIQWELKSPDFQHSNYPRRAAALSVELAAKMVEKNPSITPENYQINPPYTPKIKSLTLDYTSSLEIAVQAYQTGEAVDQLYHIHPFGYSEFQPNPKLEGQMFLPQFDYEGELYIGIQNLGTAQTLSLLFQLAEGSADPDLPVEPVYWHYLSGNRWLSLQSGQLLHDGTRGLINSGIVQLKLSPAQPNTLLDPELYWIRAAIGRHSNSVCDTIDIHTQAVAATFVDQNNAADHLSQALPPETITKLVKPLPQVIAIRQPYASYSGKMAERDETFYTRISERLRHKNRALTPWDYEHLILDRFPQIYKAKCLPANPDQPGQVTIVVIPDIRNNTLFDPFEPKAPANVIADIEAFLADRIPVHANLTVKNAHYVPTKLRFAVRFQPGTDEGYAKEQLNTDLNRFLSPWAYNIDGDIVIGGRIYANVLVNFIEERPYVDFVAEIRLFKSENGRTFTAIQRTGTHGYWVEPMHPDGVLVAARQHEIDIITEAGYEEEDFRGINYMRVELDFIINPEPAVS